MLRKLWSFFRRDLGVARSYRGAFVLELFGSIFGVATFYYLSRFVHSEELTRELPAGTTYFAFALVGFAFFDYLSVSLDAFQTSLVEARNNGTLEALLVTQTSLPVMLAGSVVYPYLLLALRTVVYLGWGVVLFEFPIGGANWIGAVVLLLLSILAFAGFGILSAAYLLVFKRGNPTHWFVLGVSGLIGGTLYPVSVLPGWLQGAARLIPITYSLEGMRAALLKGATLGELWPSVRALLIFAAILLPASFAVFGWAVKRTKVTGTLTHF